jgi:SAM-dependent methyltransferase
VISEDEIYAPPRKVQRVEDCYFYHAMEIPGHGPVAGDWDLRGGEDDYLGRVALSGRRVLEIGPASGFLTFHMESRGAEVVAVELAPEGEWDIVPLAHLDLEQIRVERQDVMERLRNGFWFAHERFASKARVHYGSAYRLPPALGRFDVAVMGAVLLHTRDPLGVVQQCAGLADTLIITDLRHPELDGEPVARFLPSSETDHWHTWWQLSPDLITRFLDSIGFDDVIVTLHDQRFVAHGDEIQLPMFTVVARRAGRS